MKYNKIKDKEKLNEIIDYCNESLSLNKTAREFGISTNQVKTILKNSDRNIDFKIGGKKKYIVNENYFEVIDTEEKAYFLGLLYADGYNHTKQGRKRFSLTLQSLDEDILIKFKKALNTNAPFYYKYNNAFPQTQLTIVSRKLSEDLEKWGCVQNKTFTISYPDFLPSHLHKSFIRGYFDGDGSLMNKKCNLISTLNFCLGLDEKIKHEISINTSIYKVQNIDNHITKVWSVQGVIQVCTFLDWIYEDATIYLYRKYQKYLLIKEENYNHIYNMKSLKYKNNPKVIEIKNSYERN